MSIVTLTSGDLSIACVMFPHEWSVTLSVAHRFDGSVTSGKSGRESRRPEAEELMHRVAVHLVLKGASAQAFRQMLATVGKGWIGLPVWRDRFTGADWANRVYSAGRILDLTSSTIQAHDAARDNEHVYAPLIVGHIDELPPMPADDEELTDFVFTIVEDSPWDFRLWINGVASAGTFPAGLAPDASEAITDQGEHGLEFGRIGQTRERTIDGEEKAFVWGQRATFTLKNRTQIVALLAFFEASQGRRKAFDMPWWFRPGVSTDQAPHATKARFRANALTVDYISGNLAIAKIDVVQVPWEIVGAEGETPEQPARVHLYRVTHTLPTPQVQRFTSWRRPLTRADDGTYVPAPFAHRSIRQTTTGRNNQLQIDSFLFDDNPLTLFHPFALEGKLILEVFEIETEPVDPDAAVRIWVGEIRSTKPQGRTIDASAVFLGGIMDREIPGVLFGPLCGKRIFEPACGLDKAAFLKSGTFTAASGCELTIVTGAADAANTFVHGWVEVGSGAEWEIRSIIASEPISGGQKLTVDWPVRQEAEGQAVAFYRGCNLTVPTCKTLGAEGSWKTRFGGDPHIPQYNLSIPALPAPGAPGKK